MEITPDSIAAKLDKAGIFYKRATIDHGQQLRIIDGNGKIPDHTVINLYTSGTVVITPTEINNLRILLNKLI